MKGRDHLSTISVILALLIIFFFIVALTVANYRIYKKRDFLKSYVSQKEIEVAALRERIDQIPQDEEDDFLVEKMAREQLLLKKPGEKVVFINFPEEEDQVDEERKEEVKWWNPLTWLRTWFSGRT